MGLGRSLRKKDPLMIMKFLDTPILQREIQELPEPYTARIFRKSPSSCVLGSPLSPETWAVCSWQRPDPGLDAPRTEHSLPTFCRALSSALRNVRRLHFIHLYCHTVRTSLYLWVIRQALWKVNIRTWRQDKKNPLHSFLQSTYYSTWVATTKRNSIQNSQSTAFFL